MDIMFLIKSMLPADFDMDKAAAAFKEIGGCIKATDERTAQTAQAVAALTGAVQALQLDVGRILQLVEDQRNG